MVWGVPLQFVSPTPTASSFLTHRQNARCVARARVFCYHPRRSGRVMTCSAPRSVRDANVLVVGGGPTGALAAALLHRNGVACTLVEQSPDFLQYDLSRTYLMALQQRGAHTLASIPGLLRYLMRFSANNDRNGYSSFAVPTDGSVRRVIYLPSASEAGEMTGQARRTDSHDGGTSAHKEDDDDASLINVKQWFFRPRLQHVLKEFVQQRCSSVTTLFGATVDAVAVLDDGSMRVTVSQGAAIKHVHTRLILACDGVKSAVLRDLQSAPASRVDSKAGFARMRYSSPAVGLYVRSLKIDRRSFMQFVPGLQSHHDRRYILLGAENNRARRRVFNLNSFPLTNADADFVGGLVGTIVAPPDHDLWCVQSVDDAYALFAENFPQLADVRAVIDEDSMRRFVQARPATLPEISRPASLVATTIGAHAGDSGGGVAILGDAAHCFPPCLGQGLNAGIEDVGLLLRLFSEADENDPLAAVLQRYELARSEDIDALMRMMQYGAPYQYRQDVLRFKLYSINMLLRRRASQALPRMLTGSLVTQIGRPELRYTQVERQNARSVAILRLIALVVLSSVALIFASFLA